MKKLLKLSVFLSMLAFCPVFTACEEELGNGNEQEGTGNENEDGGQNQPEDSVGDFSLSVKSTGPDYVELSVTAPKAVEVAYLIQETSQKYTADVIFRRGKVVTVKPGDVVKLGEDLVENTSYHLFAAARLDDVTFSDVVDVPFTTGSYDFDEMLTLMERYPDGFKMHITVPEATKQRGNAISYGYGNRALYNMSLYESRGGGEAFVDLQAVATGACANSDYCFNDTTIVINDYNQILYDEKGNPVIGDTGEYVTIHDPYIPGEPMVFIAGETRYGTPDEWADVVGWVQPTHNTWTVPMFDRTTMSWTGEFAKTEFFTQQPELCEATLDISFPEDGLGINDAIVAFNPQGDFYRYYYVVLNKMAYEEIMTIYLDHDESLLQWFIISWVAANYYTVAYDTEATYINAASFFTEPLNGGETYYVLATVLGDEEGLTQRFVKTEFTTKERTKPAPVIDVTTVDTGNPYLAGFNIKAGADIFGNVQEIKGAYYACEYSREWEKYLNAKYDYPSIIKMSLQTFTSAELEKINSAEGLTVYYDLLDGETLRFGAYGCNDEYCFNIIDEDENTAAWVDYKAPMAEIDKTPVSSAYFTDLLGEWTATATMNIKQKLEDGETVVDMVRTHKSRVVISDEAPVLPEVLEPYVYDLYKGKPATDVDGMYEELKHLTDQFTEYRIERQNRLLCSGFLDFDGMRSDRYPVGRLDFRDQYDLFTAEDYSSVDVPQLIYDFGPKWFLEVLPDGRMIVPFSVATIPPLTAWPGYPFYIAGVGNGYAFYEATDEVPGFPVEISDDGNTITIKPIVVETGSDYLAAGSYYMNAVGMQPTSSELEILGTITTEIVLTRGWHGVQTASLRSASPSSVTPVGLDGSLVTELPEPVKIKSRTELHPTERVEYKLDETPNIITVDMVHKSVEELSKLKFMRYGYVK